MRLLTVLIATLALAAPAEAARKVPPGFYGITYDGELRDASAGYQDRAWGLMAKNGVESARAVFSWAWAQLTKDQAFDFSRSDRVVRDAAKHGVQLLPIVMDTPVWAREERGNWWPQRARDYARYAGALVERYGRGGDFWAENPGLPRRPLRHWQIFNEPGTSEHYGPVLRVAHDAIKDADRRAKVVLSGLTGEPHRAPWDVLRQQYKNGGIKGHFDIAALHLYTRKPANVVEGVRLFRRVMKRNGDGEKPLWMTEFGITASKGRTKAPSYQRTLRTTDRGMAKFLKRAYRFLARDHDRKDIRLDRAYWYTWSSSYERGAGIFRFAGLNRFVDGRLKPKPALRRYRESARRDQGCRKTAKGRCR